MKSFYILLFVFSTSIAAAQDYYLKGEVKDEAGNLLSNVTITHCRSGYIFSSNLSGFFGIVSNQKSDSLLFSLNGFQDQKLLVDAWNYTTIILKRVNTGSNLSENKLISLTRNLKGEPHLHSIAGRETYAALLENEFVSASKYPTTSISVNVDKASYSNLRRFINLNAKVPPDAVRIEEMLNYFNFNYKEPENGNTFQVENILTGCPWNSKNNLLFTNIRSRRISADSLPPSHLVFLIDVSASMGMPNRLPLLKTAFRNLVYNLREIDSVSIVVYGGIVGVVLPATSGADKQKIFIAIDKLTPGGFTPGESGLKLAYAVAQRHYLPLGNNRIILATDGDFNVGVRNETELEELILSQQRQGIYLTCLGIGMGNLKDSKIRTLAEKGNGNYAYIDNISEAEKVLVREFAQTFYTVATDVTLNINFNEKYVKEYRLIGFDNKAVLFKHTLLAIGGGEIGPAYSLMIVFEIVPPDLNSSTLKGKHFYPAQLVLNYKELDNTLYETLSLEPELLFTSFEELHKDYQFATAVIMFGSLLRNSKHAKQISWNQIIDLARKSAAPNNIIQQEFIQLVQKSKNIYSRRIKKNRVM
jgi:Ca-activated chloride channel family protein